MAVVSLKIDSIAAGGDGVGRTQGLVVFVPRSAPGDVITAGVSSKKHFARGMIRSVVTPSPDRIDPPCPHYTRDHCGGCQIQHISYPAQLAAKRAIVKDSIERIGKRKIDLPQIEHSPAEWRYRTKLTLAMRNRNGNWMAGLHKFDDPSRIFPLADCPITDKKVVETWREILAASEYFPDASELTGSVRLTDEGSTFVLTGGERWSEQDTFFEAVPSVTAVWWQRESDDAKVLLQDRRKNQTPAASFAQVNPAMAAELKAYVLEKVTSNNPTTVVDAYSGAGDVAIELANKGMQVKAVELDREASEWCSARLPAGSVSITAKVEDVLGDLLPVDTVIINPPRAGVDEKVSAILQSALPKLVVYVSCNPATLARDLSRMPGFEIKSLRSFDMFPQTAHVETVCELVPKSNTQ